MFFYSTVVLVFPFCFPVSLLFSMYSFLLFSFWLSIITLFPLELHPLAFQFSHPCIQVYKVMFVVLSLIKIYLMKIWWWKCCTTTIKKQKNTHTVGTKSWLWVLCFVSPVWSNTSWGGFLFVFLRSLSLFLQNLKINRLELPKSWLKETRPLHSGLTESHAKYLYFNSISRKHELIFCSCAFTELAWWIISCFLNCYT